MKKHNLLKTILLSSVIAILAMVCGCSVCPECSSASRPPETCPDFKRQPSGTPQSERDMFFILAAYTVVYNDWQTTDGPTSRGHNIGCILVAPDGTPVAWNRNCSAGANPNSTQHGEVRCMQDYIASSGNKYLEGYTIYTTLEPCIMCSGMMCLTKVGRCVYGQTDENYPDRSVGYGRAIERLKFDSSSIGGYKPYPRTPASSEASVYPYRRALDWYFSHSSPDDANITKFLTSEKAQQIYKAAKNDFETYEIQFEENIPIYQKTVELVKTSIPANKQ